MRITARYPGRCATCGLPIAAGTDVEWDRQTVRHLTADACAVARANTPAAPEPVTLALRPIAAFLGAAKTRGLKWPMLRVLDTDGQSELRLRLTVTGQAPGSVSVKRGADWLGAVRPNGEVRGALAHDAARQQHLLSVAADPVQAARTYAALMNRCCFCGLALTDEGSVEAGYGPVCADHWGLPHTARGSRVLAVA